MAYTSIRIQKMIKCNCSAHKFPHDVGKGLCQQRVTDRPSFSPPKRGLAYDLFQFLDDLENEIDKLTTEETVAIDYLLRQFKDKLTSI